MADKRDQRKGALRTKDGVRPSASLCLSLAIAASLVNPAFASASSTTATATASAKSSYPGGSKPSAYGPTVPPPAAVISHPAPTQRMAAPPPQTAPPRPSTQERSAPASRVSETRQPFQAKTFSYPRESQPYAQRAFAAQQPRLQGGYGPPRPPQNEPRSQYSNQPGRNSNDHLPQWLRQHENESPNEQERSLRQEPGFNRLSPQQQQERINTLHRLNSMSPEQRERTLMRMENMERLSPQMRDAVRSSAQQLSYLPQDRKRLVQKAFRDLREMPPEQRQAVMNSPEFAGQFSAQERSIMGNLLLVEPYQYAGPPAMQPQYGKQ